MTAVPDVRRKRVYKARPGMRVDEPTRPYALRLGGEQADWLDSYLADLGTFKSKSQKLSVFVAAAVERESGISAERTVDAPPVLRDMKDELEQRLKHDLKQWLMKLLNDHGRMEEIQTAQLAAAEGSAVDDAVIENILRGFESEE
jgi:hypothetical protein